MDVNRGNRKAFFLVSAVFVLGIALGGLATYVVTNRVQAARPQTAARNPANRAAMFTKDLNLNPQQQKQIESILNDTRAQYQALRNKIDPEYDEVRQKGRARIRALLTPEQQPEFEDLLRRMDEERRKREAADRGR